MDPFQLSLSQVNVEEQELGQSTDYESLYSFSNLVSFDSDFREEEDTHAVPVIARKLAPPAGKPSLQASIQSQDSPTSPQYASEIIQSEASDRYLHNFFKLQHESKRVSAPDNVPIASQRDIDMAMYRQRKQKYGSAKKADSSPDSEPPKQLVYSSPYPQLSANDIVVDANTEHMPEVDDDEAPDTSTDSFKAFTDTVEALALQQSVIGKSGVTPASADEIEAVLAATRQRMMQTGQLPAQSGSEEGNGGGTILASIAAQVGTELAAAAASVNTKPGIDHHQEQGKETTGLEKMGMFPDEEEDGGGSLLISMTGGSDSEDFQVQPQHPAPNTQSPSDSPSHHVQLIRIPAEEIVTVVEKHGSWFSGSSSTTTTKIKPSTEASRAQVKFPKPALPVTPPKKFAAPTPTDVAPTVNGIGGETSSVPSVPQPPKDIPDGPCTESSQTNIANIPVATIKEEQTRANEDNPPVDKVQEEHVTQAEPVKQTDSSPVEVPVALSENIQETSATQEATIKPEPVKETRMELPRPVEEANKQSTKTGPETSKQSSVHEPKKFTPPKSVRHILDNKTEPQVELLPPPEIPTTREPVVVTPTTQLPQTKALSADSLAAEVERLLKERAKLEGHIEVLEAECSAALRERAQLQTQVAAVTQQLKCQEGVARTVSSERDALSADYETLRQNRARLEQVILDSGRLMEDKDGEIATLQEDLQLAKKAHTALEGNIKEVKSQLSSKEATISDMKGKIAELYVNFQTAENNRILAENRTVSLLSENKTLLTGKEWYMEQLSLAQETKTTLQHDITKLKADIIAQTTMVERTRADNVRLQTQLKETEQRALHEKEQLARHLEAIEADMMEREATFAQIKHERYSIETLLQSRLEQGQEASVEITDELNKAQMELKRRQAHISSLEHEQAELLRRLTLAQESLLERDRAVEGLEQRGVELELQLGQAQQQLGHSQVDFSKLQEEKMSLEVELKAAREEKTTFDTSLQSLKADMGRVETNFRQMRAELTAKEEEVTALQEERDRLKEEALKNLQLHNQQTAPAPEPVVAEEIPLTTAPQEAQKLKEEVSELSRQTEHLEGEREKLREQLTQLEGRVEEVTREKTLVEQDLGMAQGRLTHMENKVRNLVEEKAEMEGRLLKANAGQASDDQELSLLRERLQQSEITLKEEQTRAHQTLQQLSLQLQTTEKELQEKQAEYEASITTLRDTLQNTEVQLQQERKAGESRSLQAQQMLQAAQAQLRESQDQAKVELAQMSGRLEVSENSLQKERDGYEEKLATLMAQLRAAQECNDKANYETALQEYSIKLQQCEHTLQQEKAAAELRLQDITIALRESRTALQHETAVNAEKMRALEAELTQAQEREVQAKAELEGFEGQLVKEVEHRTQHMDTQLIELREEISLLRREKVTWEMQLKEASTSSEKEMQDHKTSVAALEAEVLKLRAELEGAEKAGQAGRDLALELEKERGRLAGLQQTYAALREHSSRVEAALAARESSVMELSSHADSELLRQARELHALSDKLSEVEKLREEEKVAANNLKAQLVSEKEGHTKMRREVENLEHDLSQLRSDMEQAQSTIKTLHSELDGSRDRELKYKAELDKAHNEQQDLRQTRDELKREVEERTAKDPVLLQQIQTLEWQLGEKQSEVQALQEQVKIVEDRQDMQLASLQAHLQTSQAELLGLRTELAATKRDRNTLQAKVAELKGALRASVQHASLQKAEPPPGGSGDQTPTSPMPFDLQTLEGLLKDAGPITEQSKPLSVLQSTLSGLRGQISSLQSQVDQHTSAVHTSSMAWKELEAQVQDLREVCKTSAAERAASQSLMEHTLQLTGVVNNTEQ